jgi:hypothetical protein
VFFKLAYGLLVGPEDVQVYDLRGGAPAASLPSLKEAMQVAGRGKGRVTIVVSDAHCRYLVMQRPRGVRHRGELIAAMRQCFDGMFGDARRWTLRHHASPSAQSDMVVGMDSDLLECIGAEARAAGVSVVSIRPHWTAWASRLRRETRRGDHWIIACDAVWASVGYVSNGQCRFARAVRLQEGHCSVVDLLARARAHVDVPDESAPVWVGGTALPHGDAGSLAGAGPVTCADSIALWGEEGAA